MTNPFEDPDAEYVVLVNGEAQYSIWPADMNVPAGWRIAHHRDTRDAALAYVDTHWTDLRPASLAAAMDAPAA